MARHEFTGSVKAKAFARAKGRCEKCTARLMVGKYHYDHVIPDALNGKPTLENCEVLCVSCHGHKTATVDVPAIAKSNRIVAKQAARGESKWQSQGFTPAPKQHSATRRLTKGVGIFPEDQPS